MKDWIIRKLGGVPFRQHWDDIVSLANEIADLEVALHKIERQETSGANATVKRMAAIAREALGEE